MPLKAWIPNWRYPRLTLAMVIGVILIATAALLTLGSIGTPSLHFRIGVIGYLFFLGGLAGYIALTVANWLDVTP